MVSALGLLILSVAITTWHRPTFCNRKREFLLSWYSTNKWDVVCCVNAKTTQMFHRYWRGKGTGDVLQQSTIRRHRRRHISVSAVTTRQITPSLRLWENEGLMRVLGCRYNMTHDSWSNDSESWYISYSMTTRWSPYINNGNQPIRWLSSDIARYLSLDLEGGGLKPQPPSLLSPLLPSSPLPFP